MFSLWSTLNTTVTEEQTLIKTLEKYNKSFKLSLNGYYKPRTDSNSKAKGLKKNEQDMVQKLSEILNLDEQLCTDLYKEYLKSSFNQWQVATELFEKIDVDELLNIHFEKFVSYYYRERYSFVKILILISSAADGDSFFNLEHNDNYASIRQVFNKNDLNSIYKSVLKDYIQLCKNIKTIGTNPSISPLLTEEFFQKSLVQAVNELELTLEVMIVLANVMEFSLELFYEIGSEFTKYSIIKWLNNSKILAHSNCALIVNQISYLQTLIIVKTTKLDKVVLGNDTSCVLTTEEKIRFQHTDTKNLISDLVSLSGSNYAASPMMLACSSLLYKFSVDGDIGKMMTKEAKTFMNRMFASAVKENALENILMIFANNVFSNQEAILCITSIIYDLISSVLNLFDENSLGDNIRVLFDICFFCMQKNKQVCEKFWTACKQPDRENLTILMSHAIETFPINLGFTFTFFSLISKSSAEFCKQVVDYVTHMDQYCEYLEDLDQNEYISNGDAVKLTRGHILFDGYGLGEGHRGCIFSSFNSEQNSNNSHKMILQAPAVCWQINYNCYDLIKTYFSKINYLSEKNNLSCEPNVYSIIELIDSIFQHFYDIEEQLTQREFEMNSKYMEFFINSCFTLFSNLMDKEWPDSHRLITKLLDFFNKISNNVYGKLIPLLQQNELIGYKNSCEQMTVQQVLSNRHILTKNFNKLKFIFQSNDKELITNYIKLIDDLIKDNGNNIEYMNPLFCVLVFVFPNIFKWKRNSFTADIDLSLACLNLLHSVLNTSLTTFPINGLKMHQPKNETTNHGIDGLCEAILINTECSESLLNLIHVAYEYSNDQSCLNNIKKLDTILMQSISLVNRLIVIPPNVDETNETYVSLSQSALYLNLVKYINQQQSNITESSHDSQKALADSSIKENNQFIMQLDVMMSKTGYSTSSRSAFDNKNDMNWFHLLTKIAIYKSNRTLDCLLFSLFKKISQLTPLLFGSLLGQYANQIHTVILDKLTSDNEGQIITIVCEFLCSLIENQPTFFQKLADLSESNEEEEKSINKVKEGDKSILKAIFKLYSELKNDDQDYYVSIAGIYSVFYSIWSNKKLDYMNYCKSKSEFWPMLASTLHILKKEMDLNIRKDMTINNPDYNDEITSEYLEYFGIDNINYENEFPRFNEFIIEAKVKSVSYALKIYSIQVFELCFEKENTNDMVKYFSENIFEKNLIEKWLRFYGLQLRRDLNDEAQSLFNTLEIDQFQDRLVKADLSIIDKNVYNKKISSNKSQSAPNSFVATRELKSKMLLDSITSLFLLVNKITRLTTSNVKPDFFLEKITMKRIKLDVVYNSYIQSLIEIVNHFLQLNNDLFQIQQDQEKFLDFELALVKNSTNSKPNNFISLKQSNEIVKQFHSISNALMISITSIKNIDESSLLNVKHLINDLIIILEMLIMDDFNYFPSVINSIQSSIIHIFTSNASTSQIVVDIFKQDEVILKKLIGSLFKIFTMSTVNLENEQNMNSSSFHESSNIFILNARILNFLMNRINEEHWLKVMSERCVLQCLYSLFEKFIKNQKGTTIVFSVLEMLFTLANKQVEFLIKSDFNSLTCLLIGKLFDHCMTDKAEEKSEKIKSENAISWSNVLCLYFDIQTILLKNLRLLYLKDSIIFFGSYYETIARIAINSRQSFDTNVLEIMRTFGRYLTQISKYKRELLINLPQSAEFLEQLFCDMFHSSILKTRQIKTLSTRLNQQLVSNSQKQKQEQPQSTQQASTLNSKKELEKCIVAQNLIFSIMSISLDGLMNYIPNLSDNSFTTHFDEYKLLLTSQTAQPSSFDTYNAFSFGTVLWMVDYCLKISQKNEVISTGSTKSSITTTPKKSLNQTADTTSPKKGITISEELAIETKLASKQIITGVLEKLLNFLLTQIILFDRQNLNARDKKMFKRELFSEINSILQGFNKSFKRTVSTVQYASKSPTKLNTSALIGSNSTQSYNFISFSSKHTCEFFKCIQTSLQQNQD